MSKAISPLIAGVILIAFTIVAGILVTSALTSVTKQQTETATIKQQCPLASLASLEILSTSCKITNITGEAENWWNDSYSFRQPINVTNNAGTILEANYTVNITINMSDLINQGKLNASGNDTRIVWYNSTSEENIELDRILEPSTALSFDGSNDYVNIQYDASFNPPEFTITMWVKPRTISGYDGVFTNRDYGDTVGYLFGVNSGKLNLMTAQSGPSWASLTGATTLSVDNWYLITAQFNGTHLRLFLNDTEDAAPLSASSYISSTYPTMIGADDLQFSQKFDGLIDEVAFFNRSLNSTEIADLYNNGIGRHIDSTWVNTTGLVGIWHLDIDGNDNSTTVYDSSGNENNGTIINGAYHTDGKIVPNAEANNVVWFKLQENISADGWDGNYSMYYGNDGADAPMENGSNVYLFYDDFNDNSFDTSKWQVIQQVGTGYYSEENGVLKTNITGGRFSIISQDSLSDSFLAQVDVEITSLPASSHGVIDFGVKNDTTTSYSGSVFIRRQRGDAYNYIRSLHNPDAVYMASDITSSATTISFMVIKNGISWTTKYNTGSGWTTHADNYQETNALTNRFYEFHLESVTNNPLVKAEFDNAKARKYLSPEPTTSSLQTEQNQTTPGITQQYQLTTTIYNPSQIELTNITAIAVIDNQTFSQQTPYSISSGQYLTINTNASAGDIEKLRISALNCPVYIEALDVGRCE